MAQNRRCTECEVELDQLGLRDAQSRRLALVTNESKDGLLGALGEKETLTPVPYVCPECRRVHVYAEG